MYWRWRSTPLSKGKSVLRGYASCIDTSLWGEICARLQRAFGSVQQAHIWLFGQPVMRTRHGGRLVAVWDLTDRLRVVVGVRSIAVHLKNGVLAEDVSADIRAYLRELRDSLHD